jgi:hypothetical protein
MNRAWLLLSAATLGMKPYSRTPISYSIFRETDQIVLVEFGQTSMARLLKYRLYANILSGGKRGFERLTSSMKALPLTRLQVPLGLLSDLLLLLCLQRNRRTYYNFAGLGIEDPRRSMIPIVERTRLRPPVQFFQPPSHFIPARFTSIATFTVRRVDSQQGQQVAS